MVLDLKNIVLFRMHFKMLFKNAQLLCRLTCFNYRFLKDVMTHTCVLYKYIFLRLTLLMLLYYLDFPPSTYMVLWALSWCIHIYLSVTVTKIKVIRSLYRVWSVLEKQTSHYIYKKMTWYKPSHCRLIDRFRVHKFSTMVLIKL